GQPTLWKIRKKKIYYASRLSTYTGNSQHQPYAKKQMGLSARYALFLSRPRQLFAQPLLGLGMLFMKTSEFAVGSLAYLWAKLK
ncbi:MAG: hypothetical protein V1738_05960, partial [Patescibacteria group bacterium]